MRTYHGPCGHAATNPETTTMDDGDTLLFRCPRCGVWMEPVFPGLRVNEALGEEKVVLSGAFPVLVRTTAPEPGGLGPRYNGDHGYSPWSGRWSGGCRWCGRPLGSHRQAKESSAR